MSRASPGHGAISAWDHGLLFGIPTSVERLTPGDFYTADEAFLTGTATGIVAIGSVDGRRLTSAPGSMSERLIGAYRATWAEPAFATTL